MKTELERMRARMRMGTNRPWTDVTLRLPVDLIEEVKEIAPMLGWERYQTVMRRYIADGLGQDLNRLRESQVARLVASLREAGVSDAIIANAVREADIRVNEAFSK